MLTIKWLIETYCVKDWKQNPVGYLSIQTSGSLKIS